ncbi:hypothetical protein HU200_003565 [Digitaria exilis]|uniref:Uncharacterized protein n=1 Tax=Digitaria exilis TaxID=1010633 RepID=A0A835FWH6_9POAL|nr:hypothetical protein HU200_003565 [Digitaria exilis]
MGHKHNTRYSGHPAQHVPFIPPPTDKGSSSSSLSDHLNHQQGAGRHAIAFRAHSLKPPPTSSGSRRTRRRGSSALRLFDEMPPADPPSPRWRSVDNDGGFPEIEQAEGYASIRGRLGLPAAMDWILHRALLLWFVLLTSRTMTLLDDTNPSGRPPDSELQDKLSSCRPVRVSWSGSAEHTPGRLSRGPARAVRGGGSLGNARAKAACALTWPWTRAPHSTRSAPSSFVARVACPFTPPHHATPNRRRRDALVVRVVLGLEVTVATQRFVCSSCDAWAPPSPTRQALAKPTHSHLPKRMWLEDRLGQGARWRGTFGDLRTPLCPLPSPVEPMDPASTEVQWWLSTGQRKPNSGEAASKPPTRGACGDFVNLEDLPAHVQDSGGFKKRTTGKRPCPHAAIMLQGVVACNMQPEKQRLGREVARPNGGPTHNTSQASLSPCFSSSDNNLLSSSAPSSQQEACSHRPAALGRPLTRPCTRTYPRQT